MSECPRYRDVQRLLAAQVDARGLESLERHLDSCPDCRERLAKLTGMSALVPGERGRWNTRSPSSAALQEAIQQLRNEAPPETSAAIPAGAERHLDFLQPSDKTGFIGRVGNYHVRRVIGWGGMGIVLEAVDLLLKRTVAIKMLSPWKMLDAETEGRFLREAQSAAALAHENVVAIHAIEQVAGKLVLVLEYVAGETLHDRVRREGKLPLDEVVRLGAQVARGLAAAHCRGLIHRDIKPANILLSEETGRAKIADFGLAKPTGEEGLTQDGTVVGTPEFMSPEQASNAQPDERSDLFSLGAVLYFAATGISPFRGETLEMTLVNVFRCEPQPLKQLAPQLPAWFCELVDRLLAKAPQDRLGWATAVAEILERPDAKPTLVIPTSAQATIRSLKSGEQMRSSKQWLLVAAAGVLLVGLVAVAIVGTLGLADRNKIVPEAQSPSAASPLSSSPSQPPPPGFEIVGQDATLASLAAAIEAAKDGDIIEVRGNGPFLTPPLAIDGKRLTIRAAVGSHPLILSETPSSAGTKPLLNSDMDLRLEGLEIHWAIEPRMGVSEADMLARSIVVCTHGRLLVTHCRIVSERLNGCVGGACQTVIVHRSHLLAKRGMGVFWRLEPAGRLDIDGCVLENQFGIDLLAGSRATGDAPAQVRVSRSTLSAIQSVQLIVESPIRQPIPFAFDHNLVDADYLIVLFPRLPPRAKAALKLDDPPTVLRSWVAWSEDSNAYRVGLHYLARPVPGQMAAPQPAGIANVDRWLELWKLLSAKSIEGKIRFQARPASAKTAPLVLAEISDPSGVLPTGVGASSDLVGPGPAYDAWRKSPEYSLWPPAP